MTDTKQALLALESKTQNLRGKLAWKPQQLDEIHKLYASYVELGQSFPVDLEEHSLQLILKFVRPDDVHARRRLCFLRLQRGDHLTEEQIVAAFPEYPGEADMYAFWGPLYDSAHSEGCAAHLDIPTRTLQDRFPDCPYCLYYRSSWLFHFKNAAESLALLEHAQHLVVSHDYLARLYIFVLHYEGRPGGTPGLRDKAREFIKVFFKSYTGDLWRDPDFRKLQAHGIDRGIPSIMVVTLPKSGSVFLLNTLSRGLSIPSTYLCPLGLYYDFPIEERVRDFADGGAISVDHLEATDCNLDTLYRYGIRKIILHYRDVRQAALSYVHHTTSDEIVNESRMGVLLRRDRIANDDLAFEHAYRRLFSEQLTFLERWAARIGTDQRFEFLVTNFDDLESESDLLIRILSFYQIPQELFDWSIVASDKRERAGHFRKGLKDEWQRVLSAELKAEIEEKILDKPILARLDESRQARLD